MGGNPFAITSDELIKRQQGINGAGSTEGVQNTKETREAKAKEELKGTNVLAQTNGGSMATTDGVFENYDGFTFSGARVQANSVDQESKKGHSLLNATSGAISDSKSAKSDCKGYQATANEDIEKINENVNKTKSAERKTKNVVNQNIQQKRNMDQQNSGLKNEVDILNNEIETLMAEDGQEYTPQVATEAQMPTVKAMENPIQDNGNSQQGGGANQGVNNLGVGNAGGAQTFAMNSLPSGQQEYAPTSLTGMATQRSENMKNNPQGGNRAQTKSNNAQPKSNSSQSQAGSSLTAFGNSVTGKNADKINELLEEVDGKNSQITSNSRKASSFITTALKSAQQYGKQITTTSNIVNTAKDVNTQNSSGADTANTVGLVTTTTGGLASAVGGAMMVWGSKTLGAKLVAGGGLATGVGTGTQAVASATQGNINEALGQAANGLNAVSSSFSSYDSNMTRIKNEADKKANPGTTT